MKADRDLRAVTGERAACSVHRPVARKSMHATRPEARGHEVAARHGSGVCVVFDANRPENGLPGFAIFVLPALG